MNAAAGAVAAGATVIRFAPALGDWLGANLDRGAAPAALVQTMVAQRMEPAAAQAIVEAFVSARAQNRPLPVDAIEVAGLGVAPSPPKLKPGRWIDTPDRRVGVLARSEQPTLALLGGLLSAEECAALIALARPRLKPSTVVDPASGADVVAAHRSSHGMFFRLGENALIERLDRRIAALTGLPVENGEGLQVLHYPAGAENAPHHDFLQPASAANRASIARSGQRMSTVVGYLNEVEAGGETFFPELGWSVSPARGNAVYFEYGDDHGRVDPRLLHGSRPVQAGEKWVLSKWTRQRRFVSLGEAASEGMML